MEEMDALSNNPNSCTIFYLLSFSSKYLELVSIPVICACNTAQYMIGLPLSFQHHSSVCCRHSEHSGWSSTTLM